VLKCDLAILFVRHGPQRGHLPLNQWPWSEWVSAIQEVRHHTLFPVNSPKFSHVCNWSRQFFKTNLNIWCIFEYTAQLITKTCVVLGSVTPIRIQRTNRISSTSYQPVQTLSLNDFSLSLPLVRSWPTCINNCHSHMLHVLQWMSMCTQNGNFICSGNTNSHVKQ